MNVEKTQIPEELLGMFEIKKIDILTNMGLSDGAYTVEAVLPEEAFRKELNPECVYFMVKKAEPALKGEAFLKVLQGGKDE
jgi:hypothetical protein